MDTLADPPYEPPTLRTSRLILRPLTDADEADVLAYAGNPAVSRYTLWEAHRGLADSRYFLDYAKHNYAFNRVPEPMAVALPDGPVIGAAGCYWASKPNRCMELGFALGEAYWGRGLMVEAARELLNYVFGNYNVERVQAHCMAGNDRSARVLEKLGMPFEGVARSALWHRARFWDLRRYAVLRGEWVGTGRS